MLGDKYLKNRLIILGKTIINTSKTFVNSRYISGIKLKSGIAKDITKIIRLLTVTAKANLNTSSNPAF